MTRIATKTLWRIVLIGFVAALVVFFAVATSGFRNWNGNEWFNYWGKGKPAATVPATDPDDVPNAAEPSVMRALSLNNGLVYDSDDTSVTVAIKKEIAPKISVYEDKIEVSFVKYEALSNYSEYPDPVCQIDAVMVTLRDTGYYFDDYSGRKTLKTVPFVINRDLGFPIAGKSIYITREEFKSAFPEAFNNAANCPVFRVYAKTLDNSVFLGSDETSFDVFVDGSAPEVVFDGTTIKVARKPTCLPYDFVDFNVSDHTIIPFFRTNIELRVGAVNSSGYLNYKGTTDLNIPEGTNSNFVYNSPAFSSDDDYIYCDLTQLSFADSVGEYGLCLYAYTIGCSRSTGMQGVSYIPDCPVLSSIVPYYFMITKLAAPTNVVSDNYILKWDPVEGACGYAVFSGDRNWTIEKPEFDLRDKGLSNGEQLFRIRALGNVGQALAESDMTARSLTAYNASSNITQSVLLTYVVNGDTVTKFVPYNSALSAHLYDVDIKNKEFGGWYYDDGYSRKVEPTDKLCNDTTIYARLSDLTVTDRPLTWWEQYRWYVLIPLFVVIGAAMTAGVALAVKSKKSK